MISACLLIRSERGRFEEVVKEIRQYKELRRIFPVLGRWDIVADLEVPDFETLGNITARIARMAGIVFTETLIEVKRKGE